MNPRVLQILIVLLAVGILGFGAYESFRLLYKPRTAPTKPKPVNLQDYASDSDTTLKFTLKGPIVAQEKHLEQTITVTPTGRQITTYRGYDGTNVVDDRTYPNDQTAFSEFATALQKSGFTAGSDKTAGATDDTGACPTGHRADYDVAAGSASIMHTWSSTCGDGIFTGQPTTIQLLFQDQIPDFNQLPSTLRP